MYLALTSATALPCLGLQACGWWSQSAFLDLELKHSCGLDVTSSLTETLSLRVNRAETLFLRLFDADQSLSAPQA